MDSMSREEQLKITSEHLSGHGSVEKWLIPYAVTLAILILGIVVMFTLYFLRRRAKREEARKGYSATTTDSDEALGRLNEVVDPELAPSTSNSRQNGPIVVNHGASRQNSNPPPYPATTYNQSNNSNISSFEPEWCKMPSSDL